jgi:hypothetical protein
MAHSWGIPGTLSIKDIVWISFKETGDWEEL